MSKGAISRIVLTYAQLGPPPSIMDEEGLTRSIGEQTVGYRLGQPRPVADSLAVQQTSPTQQEIAGKGEDFSGRLVQINTLEIEPVPMYRVDVVPVLLKQVKPVYPEETRKAGIEGTVIVEGVVNIDGALVNLKIRSSSGYPVLDSVALGAARQYLFAPGRQKDKVVPVIITIPIEFSCRGG